MGITACKTSVYPRGPMEWRWDDPGRKGTDSVSPLCRGLPWAGGELARLRSVHFPPHTGELEGLRDATRDKCKCWTLSSACSEPHSSPAHRGSHQHFAAKEAGSGGLAETTQLLEARREHRAEHCAFPSAALTSPQHFWRLRGVSHLFKVQPKESPSPTLAEDFSFGNTFEN